MTVTDPTPQTSPDDAQLARAVTQLALRSRALLSLVDAYDSNTYPLLGDLGDHLGISLAYVDRDIINAHLERAHTDAESTAVTGQFSALDFDDHVGDHAHSRTDSIDIVLNKAGVPGVGTANGLRQ